MLMDKEASFFDKVTLVATGNSDIYDASGPINLGEGRRLALVTSLSAVGGAAPTLAYDLVGADDVAFGVNKITIITVAAHTPVNGLAERNALPNHQRKRFFRLECVLGGAGVTMLINSGFVLDEQTVGQPQQLP